MKLYYENKNGKLYQGDCLEVMDKLIEEGVKFDAIICDPPYQITNCSWDLLIPFNNYIKVTNKRGKEIVMYEQDYIMYMLENTDKSYEYIKDEFMQNSKEGMWQKLNKLIKDNGAIVLFGSEPFSSALRMSNIKNYKYDWYWNKTKPVGFLNAKKMPLKDIETISIFYSNLPTYNPQGTISVSKINNNSNKTKKHNNISGQNGGALKTTHYIQDTSNYPRQVLKYSIENGLHPTQKPVALIEYLIKTYSNEGELILDFTSGSSTTAVACENTNRKWICIEKEDKYCEISKKRLDNLNQK